MLNSNIISQINKAGYVEIDISIMEMLVTLPVEQERAVLDRSLASLKTVFHFRKLKIL
jgi:hypothetical protein